MFTDCTKHASAGDLIHWKQVFTQTRLSSSYSKLTGPWWNIKRCLQFRMNSNLQFFRFFLFFDYGSWFDQNFRFQSQHFPELLEKQTTRDFVRIVTRNFRSIWICCRNFRDFRLDDSQFRNQQLLDFYLEIFVPFASIWKLPERLIEYKAPDRLFYTITFKSQPSSTPTTRQQQRQKLCQAVSIPSCQNYSGAAWNPWQIITAWTSPVLIYMTWVRIKWTGRVAPVLLGFDISVWKREKDEKYPNWK